jgi:hypothetical protein
MKRLGMLAVLVMCAISFAVAQNNQMPLGDVVKQPKPAKKASRVITNEEIPSRPEEPSQPAASGSSNAGGASADASGATASTGGKADAKPASGKEDSPEVAAIKARLKEVMSDELNLSSSIKDTEAAINREPDYSRRDVLSNILASQKKSLERRQSERADLRGKLDQAQKPR